MAKPLPPRRAALAAASAVFALSFFLLVIDEPQICGESPAVYVSRSLRCLSVSSSGHDSYKQDDDEMSEVSDQNRRDNIMHTFFEPIDPKSRGALNGAHLRNNTELRTLNVWRSAWESRGWTVRVLTLDDARQHPEFDAYNAYLSSIPLGGNSFYNRLCYLRWLAMAAVGGGWMSDMDTLPIVGPSTPGAKTARKERFTSFGGSVPSLLHGSSNEWMRMFRLLLDAAKNGKPIQTGKHQLYSDMMGLQALCSPRGQAYDVHDEVIQSYEDFRQLVAEPMTEKGAYAREECHKLEKFKAVHFSHVTVAEALGVDPWKRSGGKGVISLQEKLRDRPLMMQEWTTMLDECGKKGKDLLKATR